MIVEFEWFPPWKEELAEDIKLQERAAQRLVDYFNNGDLYMNSKHAKMAGATLVRKGKTKDEGSYGVRFEVEMLVLVSA